MNKPVFLLILPLLFTAILFLSDDTQALTDNHNVDLPALIKQCEGCHGSDKHPDVSDLAGKPISDFKEAMAQFYYFERHCPDKKPWTNRGPGSSTNMCSIASTLSDDEVMTLAQYFNSQ